MSSLWAAWCISRLLIERRHLVCACSQIIVYIVRAYSHNWLVYVQHGEKGRGHDVEDGSH